MKKEHTPFHENMRISFAVYIVIMLGLLYGKGITSHEFRLKLVNSLGYWETVQRYMNLTPFKTIRPFLEWYPDYNLREKILNQTVGNILIFVPFGVYLPYFSKKKRSCANFLFFSLFLIFCIEISQVLSLFGSFDVDDIILNLIGCLIGFVCYQLSAGTARLFHSVKKR